MSRLALPILLCGAFVAGSCSTPPPRPWLRYEPDGATTWTAGPNGHLTSVMHGASVDLDLGRPETRAQVTVRNGTDKPVEFRMGPEGGRPRGAIGEVLLRPLSGPPGTGGPDMIAYNAMQAIVVEPGWSGVFHLDAPLGREPSLGQFFVLTVEARDAQGVCQRHRLPLKATNAGTVAADGH